MAARRVPKLIEAGARAPDFRLPILDGGEASLGELVANGPILLAFFKISCPVCELTLPYLARVHAAGAIRVYAISQNDPDDTRDFNRHFGLLLPALLYPEDDHFPASNAYGLS